MWEMSGSPHTPGLDTIFSRAMPCFFLRTNTFSRAQFTGLGLLNNLEFHESLKMFKLPSTIKLL